MLLPLRYFGDPILRRKCQKVSVVTDDIRRLAQDMIETMDASNGIGLAACQVGAEVSLFVLRNYVTDEQGHLHLSDPLVFINPVICSVSKETAVEEEGCLSIPGIKAPVERPLKAVIEALDAEGRPFREELEGYNARVRLHENDHLNGVLFVDRLSKTERAKIDPLLREIKKAHPIPQEG